MDIKKKISIGTLAISISLGSLALHTGCSSNSPPKQVKTDQAKKVRNEFYSLDIDGEYDMDKSCGAEEGKKCGAEDSKKCGAADKACGGAELAEGIPTDNWRGIGDSGLSEPEAKLEATQPTRGPKESKKVENSKQALPTIEQAKKLATSDSLRTKTPQLLARIDGPDQQPLPFVSHDISVIVANHRVRVVQDMVFHNQTERSLSGNLMVELPDGASPCYMGMFQGKGWENDKLSKLLNPELPRMETLVAQEIKMQSSWQVDDYRVDWGELRSARVVEPVQGRQVYESITRRRIDPALSEWAGSGKFSTRIFPIPEKSYKRVVFAYDQPLKSKNGNLLHSLPLPQEIKAQTRLAVYTIGDSLLDPKIIAGSEQLTKINMGYGYKWLFSPTKDFPGSMIFQATAKNPKWQILVGKDPQVPGKLIHLSYQPDVPIKKTFVKTDKALFILDISYSAKDKLAALSGKMLRALIEQDTSIKEFAIIGFDVRTRWITNGFKTNNRKNREKALKLIENIWLEGATNFASVMQFITKNSELEVADTLFLLSDGQITWGVENPQKFAKGFPKLLAKRWICYSFGNVPSNKNLFQVLSHGQGQVVHIGLGQDLTQSAKAHLLAASSLDGVVTSKEEELVVSGNPQKIYPGQKLQIAVKVAEETKELDLILVINGKEQNVSIPLEDNSLTAFLAARAWADLYAERLLNLYDTNANKVALALSQRFALTNRQASFIILETDQEYTIYKIEQQQLNIKKLAQLAKQAYLNRPFGAPSLDELSPQSKEWIADLESVSKLSIWQAPKPFVIRDTLDSILDAPQEKRGKNTPAELYAWARSLSKNDKAQALRVLSTIVEVKPQDDKALRLVGYVLMEWSMYQEALDLFSRVRQRRPFEPQNYLMEAMALAAQGQVKEAAIRYEIILQKDFSRFGGYVQPVAKNLYADLLRAVAAKYPNLRRLCYQRLDSLREKLAAKGQLLLFWNLDNTDVDLYIQEDNNTEIYYQNKTSSTGGKLFWDNTEGLGPELYHHPTLSKAGFRVSVNYFGSSSVEGAAPATTLVAAFTGNDNMSKYKVRWYTTVLGKVNKGKIYIMPVWK